MSRSVWWLLLLSSIACNTNTAAPSSDGWPWQSLSISGAVALHGQAKLSGDTVQVRLVLQNQGNSGARVEFGVCAFAVEGVGRRGATWDNHPLPNVGCADFGLIVDLKPGESREIPVFRTTATHIHELVPHDYYEISIVVREAGALRRVPAGGLDL